jgi:exonuclease SbcD
MLYGFSGENLICPAYCSLNFRLLTDALPANSMYTCRWEGDIVLKLLHTADIHLGAKFLGLGDKGAIQREQIKISFKKLISQAITEKVGIVLISGDLFDSNQQPQANIDLVIEQFGLLAANSIPVCLIPGTHDCFDSGSIYRKVDFSKVCPNLTLFLKEGWNHREFSNLGLTVYVKPNFSNRSSRSPLEGLKRLTESPHHVAMAHGSFSIPGKTAEDDHVFTSEQIQNSQMQYIALGHWHRPFPCPGGGVSAWYSGSPEITAMDQKQTGSVLMVTIPDSGEIKVEPVQIGVRFCDDLEIDLSGPGSLLQLKSRIMSGASPNLIRKVILKGLRNEDIYFSAEEMERDFSQHFFYIKVEDKSHPRIAELDEGMYHDRLILARFVKLMKERIESSSGEDLLVAEEALQYGLALLQGKEVI